MDRESIRSRLEQLVQAHSQAEVARKTGTAPPAVHRYLQGAKMPADFCASLVKELGVNPAWLLTGEGATYLADVSADTTRMAGDLLDLVAAMNQVARMRLGSLTGKDHLKVLRELNDAIREYERLRENLDEHTGPFFRKVLEDYRIAVMDRKDLTRAKPLREIARQLSSMNNDTNLRWRMLSLMSYHAYLQGAAEESIQLQKSVFRLSLSGGRDFDRADYREARGLVLGLNRAGYRAEARAIAGATIELLGVVPELSEQRREMKLVAAIVDVDRGKPGDAVSVITGEFGRLSDHQKVSLSGALLRVLLMVGAVRLQGSLEVGQPGRSRASQILNYALWQDTPEALSFALEHAVGDPEFRLPPDDDEALVAAAMLEAQRGKPAKLRRVYEELDSRVASAEPKHSIFESAVRCAQAARYCLKPATARRAILAAEDLRQQLPEPVEPDLLLLGTHFRNAVELCPRNPGSRWQTLHADAQDYFASYTRKGYNCFEPLCDSGSRSNS